MTNKIRIEFLDGIRGLSALYVVIYHAMLFTCNSLQFSNNYLLRSVQVMVSVGHVSVAIFIVLSGYCLAIPVVNNNFGLKGGFKRYIKRRANRILPPYFIAIILSLILIYLFPVLQTPHQTGWDSKIPISTWAVISHFLLIHNLNNDWILKINGAMWSVATEWQIYFMFPIMIFLWKKVNLLISLLALGIITLVLHKFFPNAHFQYILLFFAGVISAYCSFNKMTTLKYSSLFLRTATVTILLCLIIIYKNIFSSFITETVFGALISIIIAEIVLYKKTGNDLLIDKILSSKFPMFLGKISYSVYLIHGPYLALINLLLLNYGLTYSTQLMIMWFGAVPFVIVLGWGFWFFCERYFLNR